MPKETRAIGPKGLTVGILACVSLRHRLATGDTNEEMTRVALGAERRNQPRAIAFSADGKWLASGGSDTVVSIWDVDAGIEILRLKGHDGGISTLAFGSDGRTVSSFAQDGQGYLWNLMPKFTAGQPGRLVELWEALGTLEPVEAYGAQWRIIAEAEKSVEFLRGRLKPAPIADAGKVQKWIVDISNKSFAVRDAASKELLNLGDQVQASIREALKDDVPLESRRRLKQIAETIDAIPGPEVLQTSRAIVVLERIGSPDARGILESLARGAPGARATEEAAAALKRLAKRPILSP